MIKALLIEDQEHWVNKIRTIFERYGIEVIPFKQDDELLKTIQEDDADIYKVILIDWRLPGKSGLELALEIHDRKPYLRLYAITQVTNVEEVAKNLIKYPFFDDFIPKANLDNKEKMAEIAANIEKAVKELDEVLLCEPFIDKPEIRTAYLALRTSSQWSEINKKIGEKAKRLFTEAEFKKGRSLRDCIGLSKKMVLIENILVARRVIFAEIFNRRGKLHEVEHALGFYEEEDEICDDPYKICVGKFKTYCSELAIRPDDFRNNGKGVLPEEKMWLEDICENIISTKCDFPII